MDEAQAKALIRKTFENEFNEERFNRFVSELLNTMELARFNYFGAYIPDPYKDHICRYKRIGKYNDGKNRIDVLITYLKKQTSIERARSRQRNFVAGFLKGEYGSSSRKNAALVAFVPPDEEDWRFSLVKVDYIIENGEVIEKKSPARRWSFLVGKNEASHTAQSRLIHILEDDEHNPTLAQLEEAFNIESVTKEFFEGYRDLLIRTVNELDKIVESDEKVKSNFESRNINTVDFAKKLLEQIVFLYFLQKKGWFGVDRDDRWGTGPKNFLRRLFDKKYGNYENFFNDILEPLFYEALAHQRDEDFYSRFNCKIPFLNGGLFEPFNGYDWVHTDILLPDDLFSNSHRTPEGDIGDGILDVFDRFNFTVKEDEPLEKEVAIDPELLGKLYEKFNAIRPDNFGEYKKALKSKKSLEERKFNKKFGVYYTPREIVHYMCQESLINYLSTELEGKCTREDIEDFIKHGEQYIENDGTALIKEQRIKEGKQKTSNYGPKLPESIRENAKLIDEKLRDIKVCDPAVGSGAFLVGMMHEIVNARNVLSVHVKEPERTSYNFKWECIENSLYGVDVDAGACEVAKLRLWLSLIVDEEDVTKIKPLPNLDYKIVCGNSLLGFPSNVLRNFTINEEIEQLKEKYTNKTNLSEKVKIRNKINALFDELVEQAKKFFKEMEEVNFDFRVHFSEVFHEKEKGGFDVVIANPPYVRQEKIKEYKPFLQKARYKVFNSTSDLYTYFYEKAYDILKEKGHLCFISSNKWMRARYGEKLREFFKGNTKVINLIDFGGYPVFEATVDTNIILIQKIKADKEHRVKYANVQSKIDGDIVDYIEKSQNTIYQEKLDNKCWTLAGERILKLKEKIESIGKPLKEWDVKIYRGVLTGFNKAFIIDTKTKERLCEEDPKSAEILKPILRGRDIGRYYYKWAGLWVIFIPWHFPLNKDNSIQGASQKAEYKFKGQYPAIYNHLLQYKEQLSNRNKTETGIRYEWYALQRCAATYYPEFEKEKIVWQEIVREPSFAFDNKNFYCEATTFLMTGESLKYLIAILNSKPATFFFKQFYAGGGLGESGYRYKKAFLEQLPIPKISESDQKPFIELVDKILSITQKEDYDPEGGSKDNRSVKELERQIDQMVYKLYGLTDEEIKIVEGQK